MANIKNKIWKLPIELNTTRVKMLLSLSHLPVPTSGISNPKEKL